MPEQIRSPHDVVFDEVWHNTLFFCSFPIVDGQNRLLGLVTRDELDFVEEDNPRLQDIMKSRAKTVTAPEGTDSAKAYEIMHKEKVKKLPIVNDSSYFRIK
jgi:IMP dehydrogenase